MTGWLKQNLDRLIVALIVMGCLAALVNRFVSREDRHGDAATIRASLAALHRRAGATQPEAAPWPDYVRVFAYNAGRSEALLPSELTTTIFYPPQPRGTPKPPPPPLEVPAALSRPELKLGGVSFGKGTLQVAFGASDRNFAARALQVWRKPADDPEWPKAPFLTVRVAADSADPLPTGVAAAAGGYEIAIRDQSPRTPWEYRVRSAAAFPEKIKVLVDGKSQEAVVRLPEAAEDRLDLLPVGEEAPELAAALAVKTPGLASLAGGPFITRFSETVTVQFPGEVQISYEAPATIDGRESANFRIRIHRPEAAGADSEGWCQKLERFEPGDAIRLEKCRLVLKDPASGISRVTLVDADCGAKLLRLFTRTIQEPSGPKVERVAVIHDPKLGREVELLARADGGGWWPADKPGSPK